ncbi:MAG: MipA/OmpV family protein [Desulfuromonadales bacterium]|nr:MipA/OmpV family protein [Desulfuromonadales bacterium]
MKKLILLGLILSTLFLTGSAWAVKGTVGLGVGMAPDYEGSDDATAVPMFMFNHRYDSGRFVNLMGPKLRVNLLANERFSIGPVLNYHMGRDDVDNSRVDDMDDLDDAIEAGIFAAIDANNVLVGFEYLADVSDESDGYTLQGTLGYRWKATPDLTITPTVFVTAADSDYMDYYFGINNGNRGGTSLPNYNGSDGDIKDSGINVVAHYTPWEKWGVMGIFSFKALHNAAKDSPIVDDEGDDKQVTLGVMATYRWEN